MRVVDTSAWIEWIVGSPVGETLAPELPTNDQWVVPAIVQYELSRWLTREMSDAAAVRAIAFSTELVVAPLTTDIATKAAAYAKVHGLATADAIIFATANRRARGPPHLRRAFRQTAARRLYRQGIAMSGRPFFVPMIGIVLLFAALGPAVGGALFIPLSIVFKTPTDLEAIGLMVLISTLFWPRPRIDRGLYRRRRAGRGDRVSLCPVGRCGAGARAARARRRSHWRAASSMAFSCASTRSGRRSR